MTPPIPTCSGPWYELPRASHAPIRCWKSSHALAKLTIINTFLVISTDGEWDYTTNTVRFRRGQSTNLGPPSLSSRWKMLVQAFENLTSSIASPRSLMRQASLMLPIDSEEADLQKPHGLAWKNSRIWSPKSGHHHQLWPPLFHVIQASNIVPFESEDGNEQNPIDLVTKCHQKRSNQLSNSSRSCCVASPLFPANQAAKLVFSGCLWDFESNEISPKENRGRSLRESTS